MFDSRRWDVSSFVLGAAFSISSLLVFREVQQRLGRRKRSRNVYNDSSRNLEEEKEQATTIMDAPDLDLRLIRKAEAVIRWRSSDLVIVVERCTNDHNYSAILRTAEALGIQHVYIIDPPTMTDGSGVLRNPDGTIQHIPGKPMKKLTPEELEQRAQHRLFARNATEWLTLHEFATTTECLETLQQRNYQVWATDLSQEAISLDQADLVATGDYPLPKRLAVVFGTEAVGCSQEMLDKSDRRVYLPLRGYADSLNLSVATALVIHHLFLMNPHFVGSMPEDERNELRQAWFSKLACQRLLTSAQKKKRKKLLSLISYCEQIQTKVDAGEVLEDSQLTKLSNLGQYQSELTAIEESSSVSNSNPQQQNVVAAAVADLVAHPPAPLSDLRRADAHRVTFVGKGTKQKHALHWKDMPATGNERSLYNSTSDFFRTRVRELRGGDAAA